MKKKTLSQKSFDPDIYGAQPLDSEFLKPLRKLKIRRGLFHQSLGLKPGIPIDWKHVAMGLMSNEEKTRAMARFAYNLKMMGEKGII